MIVRTGSYLKNPPRAPCGANWSILLYWTVQARAENTFLLALDGDVDFQPEAVIRLVDMMKKNKGVGAACGRIHPTGSGYMPAYQTFEYAVSIPFPFTGVKFSL